MISTTERSFSITYPGDKTFRVGVCDLLGAPVDAIVNPANSGLSHGGGLAAIIADEAGPRLDQHCRKIIKEVGRIPVTKAVITVAGDLPFKGIIHAVGPRLGDDDVQEKIEKTIINCLRHADRKGWESVAFPALGTGLFAVPSEVCAAAFRKAVPLFWKNFPDTSVQQVWLCLTLNHYPEFERIFKS
jgi:O-acetyl-ADP-ribose deacetylase (regulator of RNase III)